MNDELPEPHPPPPVPSVLDFLRSWLSFGRQPRIEIPALATLASGSDSAPESVPAGVEALNRPASRLPGVLHSFPWRSLCALGLALSGQAMYEPPARAALAGSLLYALAIALLFWAASRGEWSLPAHREAPAGAEPLRFRRRPFLLSLPLAIVAFLAFGDNLFTGFNLTLWLAALGLLIGSLWLPDPGRSPLWQRLAGLLSKPRWEVHFDRWSLLVLAAAALVMFFRLYALQHTPAEPFSDHAEKLLDVFDVSRGQTHIFFPRNTGREALQMYWTLLVSWTFGTGLSFLSLKLGTALIGLLTLPYLYLLGKELGGRRLGLLGLVLTGIAYWPNVISRVGLRFPLYPLFVAPLMLHLLRGFRTRRRNEFILAGVFLGLGFHGYSPFRIVPLLVIAAFALYLLHRQSNGTRPTAAVWFVIVMLVSLIIFLPLLRYATGNPESFSYRAMTRLAGVEQPLAAPWYAVFLSNTWNALTLFNWNDGGIWVHSLPHRPAMDMISAALFLLGVVLLLIRYSRERDWRDLFLLVSIPVLLLPSILSLAFPDENPSLNRTAGALVPAFLIAALALDGLIGAFAARRRRAWAGYVLSVLLIGISASQNYDLVFRQYDRSFRDNAWNSSEMGAVIQQFGLAYGQTDTTWVVPFPHWVDTRLVGVWAGIPNRDFAMWTEQLPETLQYTGPKLFMARANTEKPELNDQNAIDVLQEIYPQGSLSLHRASVPGHEFWIYFVPAAVAP